MQVAVRLPKAALGQQETAPRRDPRPADPSRQNQGLRWQYTAHPALRPTVFVPGPVVAARKV
jgi:hypothetical protein